MCYNLREESPNAFKTATEMVLYDYFSVKNALIESGTNIAQQKSIDLMTSIEQVDMTLLEDEAHLFWMEEQERVNATVGLLKAANNIEEQRLYFSEISHNIIQNRKVFASVPSTLLYITNSQ